MSEPNEGPLVACPHCGRDNLRSRATCWSCQQSLEGAVTAPMRRGRGADDVWVGVAVALGGQFLLLYFAAFLVSPAAQLGASWLMHLTPLLYLLPSIAFGYFTHRHQLVKGVILGGAVMFMLSRPCYAVAPAILEILCRPAPGQIRHC